MANFLTPFGRDAERRSPSLTEREQGFPCDAADRALFNQLFFRLEAELGHVITHAGLTPTDARFTQVREAIQALIAAATGAGDTSQFLLTTQARVRLPIFPEIQTNAGLMSAFSPGVGLVRVPGGVTFLHRGIFPITTTQIDLPTDASKIYHLRWDSTNGFRLRDLATAGYNPNALAETNALFDSTYDDMLVARVITNSSNIATITNLVNRNQMQWEGGEGGVASVVNSGGLWDGVQYSTSFTLNWARQPRLVFWSGFAAVGQSGLVNGYCNYVFNRTSTRYSAGATIVTDYELGVSGQSPQGYLYAQAIG